MISVPRPQPVWTAHEEIKAWNVILTELRTDDGLVGYGKIHGAPMPRICGGVNRFGEIIRGMDALADEVVWAKLFGLTSPRPGGIPDGIEGNDAMPRPVPRGERAQVTAAIAGIDIAQDLERLSGTEIEQDGKRYILRNAAPGCAGTVLRTLGVALPPLIRCAQPPPAPPPRQKPRRRHSRSANARSVPSNMLI